MTTRHDEGLHRMSAHATEERPAPAELGAGHVRRRLLVLATIAAAATLVIALGPGLAGLRHRFDHAVPGWLAAGLALELLSALAYVVLLRAVFSRRLSWRTSYQ